MIPAASTSWRFIRRSDEREAHSGRLTVYDLIPGGSYVLEICDTYTTTQQVIAQQSLTAQVDGTPVLEVDSLESDLAFKLRPVSPPRWRLPALAR